MKVQEDKAEERGAGVQHERDREEDVHGDNRSDGDVHQTDEIDLGVIAVGLGEKELGHLHDEQEVGKRENPALRNPEVVDRGVGDGKKDNEVEREGAEEAVFFSILTKPSDRGDDGDKREIDRMHLPQAECEHAEHGGEESDPAEPAVEVHETPPAAGG